MVLYELRLIIGFSNGCDELFGCKAVAVWQCGVVSHNDWVRLFVGPLIDILALFRKSINENKNCNNASVTDMWQICSVLTR
mgnify:CR=1 FL=1